MDQSIHVYLDHVNMSYPASIYNATTLKQEIFSRLRLQKKKELLRDVEALKDYTLHIENGEHVGVIGHNGSGKSTLLKTIAGVYPVVSGTVDIKGSIHSLFDLGLGFDLESSGRENIIYRGLLLGATPAEIEAKSQEIIDFADLGEFIDYPIKSYSSGMLVRLAFSVSTSLTGDILLLDEVVGAGDASFMAKAQRRMKELMNGSKIMVFVTHNTTLVQQVCNRVIMMEHGRIVKDGKPDEVVAFYKKAMCAL